MHTPKFGGSMDPESAEEWMTCITRDLEYVQCPLRYRALLVSHHLSGQALHWWEKVVQEMPDGHCFTWEEFKEEFERKYYRRQNQERRLSEFLNLTVREYEAEFVRMLKHSAHLLEKAEESKKEERASRARHRSPPRCHPYTRPSGKTGQTGQSSRVQDKDKAPITQALPPPPRRGPPVCYRCQQPGHYAAYFTVRPTEPQAQATIPPRPTAGAGVAPRVYALEAEQELQEEEVHIDGVEADAIAGILLPLLACFLSADIVERIGTGKVDPMSNFTVRTPAGETLTVQGTLQGVPLDICGRQMTADLIVVPVGVYDLILGIDWLTKYQAYIDCPQRTIWFQEESGGFEFKGRGAPSTDPIISTLKAEKIIRKGNDAFLVVITATKEPKKRLKDTPVAREFPDVFSEELPRILPKREVDFRIDVLPAQSQSLRLRTGWH
ncbi:PREDICTED: uncharacterized protein LOC104807906 [Tarenaya hassleriana]|uniref:uncharacterized protein LOC104807906 n=1 Tax=Tarenaya hassleriana TaxID=28532 RepID=UPI00053C5FB6|nr:PREDICTED: uncharacterized protein LOC104807906 [Tarenaya hassleriana]